MDFRWIRILFDSSTSHLELKKATTTLYSTFTTMQNNKCSYVPLWFNFTMKIPFALESSRCNVNVCFVRQVRGAKPTWQNYVLKFLIFGFLRVCFTLSSSVYAAEGQQPRLHSHKANTDYERVRDTVHMWCLEVCVCVRVYIQCILWERPPRWRPRALEVSATCK